MKTAVVVTINLTLSVLMAGAISWFEQEEIKIENINKKHLSEIKRLEKIPHINDWIESSILPKVKLLPSNLEEGTLNIVRFYDTNAYNYNMIVDRYFYKEDISENIDFTYSVKRDDTAMLRGIFEIDYIDGFLQFLELKTSQKNISGKIEIVQLYSEGSHANLSK